MSVNDWETPFRNDSGETIPAFSVMRATGVVSVGGRVYATMAKPNAYGSQYNHYLNGPTAVPDGKYGACTGAFPALASGTGSIGDIMGPRSGSWSLQASTGGFVVIGQHGEQLLVNREPMLVFYGKFTGSVSKGSTGTVTVYWAGSSTSQTISTVYAISQAFTSSDWVNVYRINGRWEAYLRECP